mgnify:CR=1 FL=1
MRDQPRTEQLLMRFFWCQWNAPHQRLYYLQYTKWGRETSPESSPLCPVSSSRSTTTPSTKTLGVSSFTPNYFYYACFSTNCLIYSNSMLKKFFMYTSIQMNIILIWLLKVKTKWSSIVSRCASESVNTLQDPHELQTYDTGVKV